MTKVGGLLITELDLYSRVEGTVEVSMQLGIFLRGHGSLPQMRYRRGLCLHKQDEVSRRLTRSAGTGMGGYVGVSANCRAREHDCMKKNLYDETSVPKDGPGTIPDVSLEHSVPKIWLNYR